MPRKSQTIEPGQKASKREDVDTAVTPMMAQYIEIKAANPDCLLFYRMGDFYELFFEDAVVASRALGIALTKRGKHKGEDIAMCGVPVVRGEEYLQKLIERGFRVAVCEQTEDPAEAKKRGHKAVVRRDVVRLVTPGTLTEDSLLDAGRHNYLSTLFRAPGSGAGAQRFAIASLDISTGDFEVGEADAADLPGELMRIAPTEVLIADADLADQTMARATDAAGATITPAPKAHFSRTSGERDLKARLGVADLSAFGAFSPAELAAVGALLKYVELTQIGQNPPIKPPRRTTSRTALMIDAATRNNLELMRTTSGDRSASLLGALDRTLTSAGARVLATRLANPLCDLATIGTRLDAVAFLTDDADLRERLRNHLRGAPDVARAMSRLAVNRAGPRDLAMVRDALFSARGTGADLQASADHSIGLPGELDSIRATLTGAAELPLADELAAALADELPVHRRDGGFIAAGYRADLDENRALRDESRQVLAALQSRYQDETGIKSLKVRHNNVLGYFVEVTAGTASPLMHAPLSDTFSHRQTLANAVRFTTTELAEIEGRITAAGERALAIEQETFSALSSDIVAARDTLGDLGQALGDLDHIAGLALLAEEQNYIRPQLDDSTRFEIIGGRHPVVEQSLARSREDRFIENDCVLDTPSGFFPRATAGGGGDNGRDNSSAPADLVPRGFEDDGAARILLVTGPNMAGKSTYLRQNALITIMAQMGSFVPARAAHIGLVDRLFSRVGASDDLARGRSTFMVEMVETAGILNQAGERSLVILDEIGRGTATFDGLSIAWATVEHLHAVNRCRALFATHYHELTSLAGTLSSVANATMQVKEFRDEIIFLHKVGPGAADRSYGIQVAKLAGLPPAVIARAGEVLRLLEEGDNRVSTDTLAAELPLFAAARPSSVIPGSSGDRGDSDLARALKALSPDDLSPREALEELYRLKALASGQEP